MSTVRTRFPMVALMVVGVVLLGWEPPASAGDLPSYTELSVSAAMVAGGLSGLNASDPELGTSCGLGVSMVDDLSLSLGVTLLARPWEDYDNLLLSTRLGLRYVVYWVLSVEASVGPVVQMVRVPPYARYTNVGAEVNLGLRADMPLVPPLYFSPLLQAGMQVIRGDFYFTYVAGIGFTLLWDIPRK